MREIDEVEATYPNLTFIPRYDGPDFWGATLINNKVYYNPFYHDIYKILLEEGFHSEDVPDGIDITQQVTVSDIKMERKARQESFKKSLPIEKLTAYMQTYPNDDDTQIADAFGVTKEFLHEAIATYKIVASDEALKPPFYFLG